MIGDVSAAPLSHSAIARAWQRLRANMGLFLARLAVFALLLGLWQALSGTVLPTFWISSPKAVLIELWRWTLDGSLWRNLEATLVAMAAGYTLGCAGGISGGLVLAFMPRLRKMLLPYFSGMFALPKIALAPLLVLTLGIGLGSKVALVAITVFFLLLQATLDGVASVDSDVVRALTVMGASKNEIRRKVMMPGALAWIFSGMRIAVRYALTGTILGEIIASNRGMGYLIEANAGQYNATGVFAAVLALVFLCVAITETLGRLEAHMARAGDA
jgi:NitT/TauT family transport system permease protein